MNQIYFSVGRPRGILKKESHTSVISPTTKILVKIIKEDSTDSRVVFFIATVRIIVEQCSEFRSVLQLLLNGFKNVFDKREQEVY